MRMVTAVMEAAAVERILRRLGHEPRAPSLTPAQALPERDPIDEPARRFCRPSAPRRFSPRDPPGAHPEDEPTLKTGPGAGPCFPLAEGGEDSGRLARS